MNLFHEQQPPQRVERQPSTEKIEVDITHDRIAMRNTDLQKKTEDLQAEFDTIMDELVNLRSGLMGRGRIDDIWDDFYKPGSE